MEKILKRNQDLKVTVESMVANLGVMMCNRLNLKECRNLTVKWPGEAARVTELRILHQGIGVQGAIVSRQLSG